MNDTASMDSTVDVDQLLNANLPGGALHLLVSGYGEDQRLQAAAQAALQGGTSAPLVKEELRQCILLKRLQAGQPELKTDFPQPPKYELTPAEKAKRERRKDQNRRAAQRCREKKKRQSCDVKKKYSITAQENQRLRAEVSKLQKWENSMRSWLLMHQAVCTLRLPGPDPPPQPLSHNTHRHHHQQQKSARQGQHLQLPLQLPPELQQEVGRQLQHCPQTNSELQQQPLLFQGNSTPPHVPHTIPETVTAACDVPEDQKPMLDSQGFDFICSELQKHELCLDEDLTAVLGGLANPQDSVADAGHVSTAPPPSAQQTTNPPSDLISTNRLPAHPCTTTTESLTPSLPPSLSTTGPPSSTEILPHPVPSLTPLQPHSAVPPHVADAEDALLDLPGFPFNMRRKRRSVDSCSKAGKGESSQPKILKSATYPQVLSSAGDGTAMMQRNGDLAGGSLPPAPFTAGSGLGGSTVSDSTIPAFLSSSHADTTATSTTLPFFNSTTPHSADTTPAFPTTAHHHRTPPSPLLHLTTTPSPAAPTPSPSPRSPCCFRFSSVTPPPRSSFTPQPCSPLNPPTAPGSITSGSRSLSPAGVVWQWSGGEGQLVPTSSWAGPDPGPGEGGEEEGLDQHLVSFLTGLCDDDPECLNSRSINDLLQDGFMSSQED
ncbi:uncharacterized protein LOC143295964 isoform X2 [Babylonia areolata]|uniref:uncharacterized protein LOC143295964 isoform X2 n=1 Tax=Babylonia areolata TaxID=304850 RepID=UPI003FD2773B